MRARETEMATEILWEADCGHEECTARLVKFDGECEPLCVVAERAEDEAFYAADAAATRREG
jgi:hypothetical protein